MFWLYLLTRPRRHRRITVNHVRWRHPRLHNPWYWITGLAFMEFALWVMAFELAGELLAMWWLLWLAVRYGAEWTVGRNCQRWEVPRWIEAVRPVWPKRAANA